MIVSVLIAIANFSKLTRNKNLELNVTGFDLQAFTLALQCSNNWVIETHLLGEG